MNKTNASVYFSEAQLDQVTRAAIRANKTISEYIRDIMGPWAASDLKEKPAAPPTARPPAPRTAIAQAAELHGMKIAEYKAYGAEMQARRELGLPELEPLPVAPRRSTMLPPAPPVLKPRPRAIKRTSSGTFQRRAG